MLDESMHKSIVSFVFGGGDTKGKGAIMMGSANNPGTTFNNGEAGVLSTMVLIAGTTLACVVILCGSMVVMVGITFVGVVNALRIVISELINHHNIPFVGEHHETKDN